MRTHRVIIHMYDDVTYTYVHMYDDVTYTYVACAYAFALPATRQALRVIEAGA